MVYVCTPRVCSPIQQVLRHFGALDRLEGDLATCLDNEEFLRRHRSFKQGRDCSFSKDKHLHEGVPTLDGWRREYAKLPTDGEGRKIVCKTCGLVDFELKHNPTSV